MASTTDHSSDADHPALDAPAAHGPGPEGYVDFDEYIEIQLHKAGSTIKSTDVLTAVVGAGTLLTAYLLTFIVCDQWLIPGGFGGAARVALLLSLLVAVLAWIGWKVIWPWRRRVNGLYAASTIEKASPGFKGSLLNLVDLLRAERTISPEVYRSLERRAAVALTHVDVRETVDRRSLLRLSMALFAVVVLFCGYWILSPKNPASSLWRAIAPASDATVATRTKIDSVRPGDVDVVARSQVDVTAEVRGQLPPQATLYYTTADHKFVDERIDARQSAEGGREFHFVINGDNGAGILQDMSYRVVAGDDETREYKNHVIQPPAATIDSIRLDYPGYTRLTSATQTTGAIDALEGTRVTLRATANMPLRSASLQFFDEESASKRGEEVPVHVENGNKLQAEWTLQMRSDGTYPHFYRIFCTSAGGESERTPSLYSLEIRGDRPPEIVLRDPTKDLELPANAVLPLLIEARDPDFALSYINLKIEKDGAPVIGPEIYDGKDNPAQQVRKTYRWSLKEYHLRPKDTVTYWLEAQDNRKPQPNYANSSPRLRIHITDPVPESEVQKQLEMAEKKQEQEKRTDDNAGQPKDEDQVADASKPQTKSNPRSNKAEQQAQHAQNQQQDPGQKQPEQQNNDDVIPPRPEKPHMGRPSLKPGIGGGDKGAGDKGKGAGDKGADDKAGDQGNGENGDKSQSQKPNADNPGDDPKSLQKIYDHMQEQDSKKSDSGQDDNAKDKGSENPPGDKSGDKGSDSSQNDPAAKDKQPGQSGANPQPGAQPKGQDGQNPDGKNPDGKNPEGQNPDGKNPDAKNPDGQSKDGKNADGTKPNSEPNAKDGEKKDGTNPDGSKKPDPSAGDKNAADQAAQDKSNADKSNADKAGADKPGADKSGADKSGADKSPETKPGESKQASDKQNESKPNGQRQPGQKQTGDKTEEGQQPGGEQSKQDQNGKNGADKNQDGKNQDGKNQDDNQSGDKQAGGKTGENPAGDKPGDKQPGGKSPNDKSSNGKSQQDQAQRDQAQQGDRNRRTTSLRASPKRRAARTTKVSHRPAINRTPTARARGARPIKTRSATNPRPSPTPLREGVKPSDQQDKNQQSKKRRSARRMHRGGTATRTRAKRKMPSRPISRPQRRVSRWGTSRTVRTAPSQPTRRVATPTAPRKSSRRKAPSRTRASRRELPT